MTPRIAAVITCLCLPLTALKCIHGQLLTPSLDRVVTIDASDVVVVASITVRNASRVVVQFDANHEADDAIESVELAIAGVDNALTSTLAPDDDDANGTASGTLACAEAVCEGEVTLRLTRRAPTDVPLVLKLHASVLAEAPETTPEIVVERFELSADEGVFLEAKNARLRR